MKRGLFLLLALIVLLTACSKEKQPPVKEEEPVSGYYELLGSVQNGKPVEGESLNWRDHALFLLFGEDESVTMFNGTALIHGTYAQGEITTEDGSQMQYEKIGSFLVVTAADTELCFATSENEPPNLDELDKQLKLPPEVGYFVANDELANHFILLNEDGTGTLCDSYELYDISWEHNKLKSDDYGNAGYKLNGDELTVRTAHESVTFVRSSETPPDFKSLKESLKPVVPGYYLMQSVTEGNQTLNIEALKGLDTELPYMILNEDKTGFMTYFGQEMELKWTDKLIYLMGMPAEYTLKGNILTISTSQIEFVFERSNEEPPEIPEIGGEIYAKYSLYAMDMGDGYTVYPTDATLILYTNGTGSFDGEDSGYSQRVTWDEDMIKIGAIEYTYEIKSNGELVIDGMDGVFYFKPLE